VVQDALENQLMGNDLAVKKTTYDSVISAIQSDAEAKKLGLTELRQWANANSGTAGQILNIIKAWAGPIATITNSAAGAAGALMR